MNPAPLHPLEKERLEYLHKFKIEEYTATEDLDQLLDIACKMLDIPKGLISIVERDVVSFKSQFGFNLPASPRSLSFCSHAINSEDDLFYIEDAREHSYFKHHPYVNTENPVIFYAGAPIKDGDNLPLGTICVIDSVPRSLNEAQRQSLVLISKMVMSHMRLRREKVELEKKQTVLLEKNSLLKNFAHIVSHDMKMPLASMIMSSDIIRQKYRNRLDEDGIKYLKGIKSAAFSMRDYIDGILSHYESEQSVYDTKDSFDLNSMLLHIEEMLGMHRDYIEFKIPDENLQMLCDQSAVEQILLNLIGNSLKYNHEERLKVEVTAVETDKNYRISISDNGIGIPKSKQEKVFELFKTLNQQDRTGKVGHGIGLSTVKILVDKLGGVITCKSKLNQGTTFTFTVAKHVG